MFGAIIKLIKGFSNIRKRRLEEHLLTTKKESINNSLNRRNMAKMTVIPQNIEGNVVDGVIVFPQNNTLYADQFTGFTPVCDEDREGFKAKNLKDVFEHYKPCIEDIILSTIDGKEVKETLCFLEIKDFDIDRIIERSKLLSNQKAMVDTNSNCDGHATNVFKENIVRVQNAILPLEVTYRGVETFFLNTKQKNIEFLTLMNVDKKELFDLSSEDSLAIQDEIIKQYDRISLRGNYSLLVLPGYLGSAKSVHQWASFSYKYRLLIITDYKDVSNVGKKIEDDFHSGTEPYLGNIVMVANYLTAKRKSEKSNGLYDICIPASSSLAGRLANTEDWNITQTAVGIKNGVLDSVYGTRVKLQNSEMSSIITHGLIPICEMNGVVAAMSDKTLYNGHFLALRSYTFVRVIDWIDKVVQHFCNDCAMECWTSKLISELSFNIHEFLCDYKGERGIIEAFDNIKIEQDSQTRNIKVSIEITFPFMHQQFVLEIIGKYGCGIFEWKQNIFAS